MMKKEKREKHEETSFEDLVKKHAKVDTLYRKKCFLFALNAIVHNHRLNKTIINSCHIC